MKARRIKGLDPAMTLTDAAQRTVEVRLDELVVLADLAVLDPRRVAELHDARIAAKRLRYLLEVTEHCFGPYAVAARKRTKELQDLLGEVHDCDVTLPEVHRLRGALEAHDAATVAQSARDAGLDDLDGTQVTFAQHAGAWRGLTTVEVHLRARRALLFARFLDVWTQLGREGFRARLEYAASERPVRDEPVKLEAPDA